MKVAVFNSKPYDREYLTAANVQGHELVFLDPPLTEYSVIMAQGFDAVCCFVNDTVDSKVIRQLKEHDVKLLALRCAGYNNVDLDAAKMAGLTICRVPEYSPYAVAEHAVALILDLNRNIHRAFNRVRENDYSLHGLLGFDLHGKTMGIIGTGKIGVILGGIMRGFGCKVIGADPFPNDQFKKVGDYVPLDELWPAADIISLHCPLMPKTHHIINADSIRRMKKGTMIINTSRGGLLDTRAVIDGLKSGQVGYLGLDVYEEEADLFFEDYSNRIITDDVFARLVTFPNVVVTGHQAFFTREALGEIARVTMANLDAFAAGELDKLHVVNL